MEINKYIIRNCPAYSKDALDFCLAKNATQAICYNCTDCIMKQIVELCKEVENIENVKTLYDASKSGMFLQANKILKLLDIQEIE